MIRNANTGYAPRSEYFTDEYWNKLFNEYSYGRRKNSLDETPEAPKEELAKALSVQKVDLQFESNTLRHRTDQYDCIDDRKNDIGQDLPAKLVLRRGAPFNMTLEFDRPYDNEKHDLRLCFAYVRCAINAVEYTGCTIQLVNSAYPDETAPAGAVSSGSLLFTGKDPKAAKGTLVEFKMDESGKQKLKSDEWGASIKTNSGNSIDVEVHVPANCPVGVWDLTMKTYSAGGKNETGEDVFLIFKYSDIPDIIILFNAWCKDDPCYMDSEALLSEYVLNDDGCIFKTNYAKSWQFAQFEDGVVEAALYLINEGLYKVSHLADPITVSRCLALMVNSSRGGVVQGNWSGDYDDGTMPSRWSNSSDILLQYMKDKLPVKYGQCWVYSAVLTTVCRAVGIPCRSVTNIDSAHDTEENCIIDRVIDAAGEDVTDNWTSDSVWNFHVWNEVWLARRDIFGVEDVDGWQALDATPQEMSLVRGDVFSTSYTCGPYPVRAIKTGRCDLNYDGRFIFSEVNADVIQWQIDEKGNSTVNEIIKDTVGTCLLTHKPGTIHPPFEYDPIDSCYRYLTDRLDVTHEYKFREGTEQERDAVLMAQKTAGYPNPGLYKDAEFRKDVKFELVHISNRLIGSDLPIEVKAMNRCEEERVIKKMVLRVYPKTYTGIIKKVYFKKEFNNIKLGVEQEENFSVKLTQSDYLPHLVERACVEIEIYAEIAETATAKEERTLKYRGFEFDVPGLKVKGTRLAKHGSTVEYNIQFTNPLNITLTNCTLIGKSTALKKRDEEKVPDIPPNGEMNHTLKFTVKDKLKKSQHPILFTLDTKELQDVFDGLTVGFTA